MEAVARTLQLFDNGIEMPWMGPDRYIMAYPIKNNHLYNMVLLHPSEAYPLFGYTNRLKH